MDDENAVADGIDSDAPAKRKPLPMRTKALLGLLGVMSVTFGVNSAHVYALENELRKIAEEKEQEERDRAGLLGVSVDTAHIVTASKAYLIYGEVQGKIEVYVRKTDTESRIIGMDYFLAREEDGWKVFESGACADAACQRRGTKALAAE